MFLINVPVGLAFAVLVMVLIPRSTRPAAAGLDAAGAVSVTAGLMAIVFAINRSVDDGWTSTTVLGFPPRRCGAARRVRHGRVAGRHAIAAAGDVPAAQPAGGDRRVCTRMGRVLRHDL